MVCLVFPSCSGHRIVLSKRSDVGEYDFDMISLIQPISLEMSHVTGHVTMECIRRFIQSCSKSVKVSEVYVQV